MDGRLVELTSLLPLWFSLFGLLLGSFLNVCIYRVPRDLSVVAPRSFCPECGTAIAWYHNVPVASFFLLRGKCYSCGHPIPWRYPLVEITASFLFGWVAYRYGWTVDTLKWIFFASVLLVLFWTDVEERLLPDEFTIGGTLAGLMFAVFVPVHAGVTDLLLSSWPSLPRSVLNALLGSIVLVTPLWLFSWLYGRVRKREGLGFGDIKLLAFIGTFLGIDAGLFALLIGAVGGSIVSLLYVLATRKNAQTYELPFGSFLCVGAVIVPLATKLVRA